VSPPATSATRVFSSSSPRVRFQANYLLAEAVQRLPAATVYAAFAGIGTAGTTVVGMVCFGESTNIGRICSLALILLGLIGLSAFSETSG